MSVPVGPGPAKVVDPPTEIWVRAHGPLDETSGQILRDRTVSAGIEPGREKIRLDLHAVTTIDADGVEALAGIRRDLIAAGVELSVDAGTDAERAALLAPLLAQEPDRVNRRRHAIGDAVELHTKFDDSWCGGFEIAEVRDDGYVVRRRHDHELLPRPTSEGDLRAVTSITQQVE